MRAAAAGSTDERRERASSRAAEIEVVPEPNEVAPMRQRRNSMWLDVSVPVLSEKTCVMAPSSSSSPCDRTWQGSSAASSYIWTSLRTKVALIVFTIEIET